MPISKEKRSRAEQKDPIVIQMQKLFVQLKGRVQKALHKEEFIDVIRYENNLLKRRSNQVSIHLKHPYKKQRYFARFIKPFDITSLYSLMADENDIGLVPNSITIIKCDV